LKPKPNDALFLADISQRKS